MRHFSCPYRSFEENTWRVKRLVWDGTESEPTSKGAPKAETEEQPVSELDNLKKNVDEKFLDTFTKLEGTFTKLKQSLDKEKDANKKKNILAQIRRNEGQIDKLTDQMGASLKYETEDRKEALMTVIEKTDKLKMATMAARGAHSYEYLMMLKSPSYATVVEDLISLRNNFTVSKMIDMFGMYANKVGTLMAYFGKQTVGYVGSAWDKAKKLVGGEEGEERKPEKSKSKEDSKKKTDKGDNSADKKKRSSVTEGRSDDGEDKRKNNNNGDIIPKERQKNAQERPSSSAERINFKKLDFDSISINDNLSYQVQINKKNYSINFLGEVLEPRNPKKSEKLSSIIEYISKNQYRIHALINKVVNSTDASMSLKRGLRTFSPIAERSFMALILLSQKILNKKHPEKFVDAMIFSEKFLPQFFKRSYPKESLETAVKKTINNRHFISAIENKLSPKPRNKTILSEQTWDN